MVTPQLFFSSLLILVITTSIFQIQGQEQALYRKPPSPIVDILAREPTPDVQIGPKRRLLALIHRKSMPGIKELAQPMLRLAGTRLNPKTNGPAAGRSGSVKGFSILQIRDQKIWKVDVPESPALSSPLWSPDGKKLAFYNTLPDGIEVWVSDIMEGSSKRLLPGSLNLAVGSCKWTPDSKNLLCFIIPEGRGSEPEPELAPGGPLIQGTEKKTAQVRTYQDLLRTPYDVSLYEYYFTSQMVMINTDNGSVRKISKPAIFGDVEISPDGRHLLVERIVPPFSFSVPQYYFPMEVEIWDQQARLIYKVASLPLAEEVPIGGVRRGPRSYRWVPDEDATLLWVEALDEGNPKSEVDYRDQIVRIETPFNEKPVEVFKTEFRFDSRRSSWGRNRLSLLAEYDRPSQRSRTWLVGFQADTEPELLWDRNVYDSYNDPGSPLSTYTSSGNRVILQHEDSIFLRGPGSSPDGDYPFLDRFDLRTKEKERIFLSAENTYESVIASIDGEGSALITRHETETEPPNYYLRDQEGNQTALTDFADPAPELKGTEKKLIKYWREDGIELSATLYLPPDYEQGKTLPMVMWAYPVEYVDPHAASQVRGSSHRFTRVNGASHLFFLTQGYTVLDRVAMPIVGEEGNDTFVEQLVMNAKAAIDEVVRLGIADLNRIGIGGHSYGAFMTANLLAHSDFFAAGIARSGAYNRSLTPFGFQNERRTFWENPEVYFAMSPFMHADKINEPILMTHGIVDNNSGTFPLQSERLFHALKGLGATARLVMLPLESHGYIAEESVMHTLAEMVAWFDKYLK